MALRAAVLGASGFTGGEVTRLLAAHPEVTEIIVGVRSELGERLAERQPHLGALELTPAPIEEAAAAAADVCFSCLPGTALPPLLPAMDAGVLLDLADDFRGETGWVYGLTEFARDRLDGAPRIANPGCYPTAALLALVPFARAGVIGEEVVLDALSGLSGAGRSASDRLSLSIAHGNATAYGTTDHRHVPEIERGLAAFGFTDAKVSFTPHLVPMPRGLLVTARARPTRKMNDTDCLAILRDAFEKEPFVHVTDDWPSTKPLVGSNGVHVSARVDARAGWIVCSAALDNLGKGAAGQALQNANVALGMEESLGLSPVGVWP